MRLFGCEDIKEGEYIVEYTGRYLKHKYKKLNDYIIEVNRPIRSNQSTKIYIDTVNLKGMAKYCNHSCVNNAKITKIFRSERSRDEFWVKAIKDINCDEEIFVH